MGKRSPAPNPPYTRCRAKPLPPCLEKLFRPPPHAPRLLHHHHAGPAPARHHRRILAPRPGGATDGAASRCSRAAGVEREPNPARALASLDADERARHER